jgi:hypothetical protein
MSKRTRHERQRFRTALRAVLRFANLGQIRLLATEGHRERASPEVLLRELLAELHDSQKRTIRASGLQ